MYQQLKQTPCPHCKMTGTLILHGSLYGYAENDDCRKARRCRRIFCNNPKSRNNGCGRTFSVWGSDKLRRLRLSAGCLWRFLALVIRIGNKAAALRDSGADLGVSSAYRIWKRFKNRQSRIRAALAQCCTPPEMLQSRRPAEQTLAHLQAAFPSDPCPIAAFQHCLQMAFL